MKKVLLIVVVTLLYSCQEKFDPEKFRGGWVPDYKSEDYSALPYLKFNKDSIYFEDTYGFFSVQKYELKKRIIYIEHGDSIFKRSFQFNSKDSTLTLDGKKYLYLPSYFSDSEPIRYNLIGLKLPKTIAPKELSRYESGFHLIKNKDTVHVKLNDRLRPYEDISRFVFNQSPHFDLLGNIIYIGEHIRLKDILKAYYYLAKVNMQRVVLVTHFDLESELYNVHLEKIDLWNEQLNEYFPLDQEMQFEINNRSYYIKKYDPTLLEVHSKNDLLKLNQIISDRNYLISINSNLNLEDYFRLKQKIQKIRREMKSNIRTEFIGSIQ